MQYMLMFYENEAEIAAQRDHAERAGPYWDAWNAYIGALYEAGVVVKGDGLLPPATATTVRLEGGNRLVQDGPVAATKEQLAGYVVIEVPDLDAALSWAARSPSASNGATEVRPVLPRPTKAKRWTAAFKNTGGGRRRTLPAPPMGASSRISREHGATWRRLKMRSRRPLPKRSTSGPRKACRPTPMPG
jgi:hypothetical protein